MTTLVDATRLKMKLDAGRFAALAEDSFTLPAEWYYDPDVYRLEHEAIFYKTWWYQCHEGDLPGPGSYVAGRIADQGILIMRGEDRTIRAFYNVCSHRAHPLLEGRGQTTLVVCPYHQWCYQANGRFRGARGRDSLKDWIPDNADLKPVRVEVMGGLVFVNLDLNAKPLIEQAGKLAADWAATCPRLLDLKTAFSFERDVAANWKTVIDNNHECYHCAVNHKSLMELVDYDTKAVWSDSGITFSHSVEKKLLDNSAYKVDAATLEQEALFGYIWPTTIPLMWPGSANLVIFQVNPTGPETTRERFDFLFPSTELGKEQEDFISFIRDTLVPEDVGLCENVQKGLHSRGYRQGRFVVDRSHCEFSEHHVHFFQSFVRQALLGS
jgi:choline monooxygenase